MLNNPLLQGPKAKYAGAFLSFFIAFVTYALTMAPTLSFWDCGEFIACADTLGIPHPPGTPFFVVLSRAVILLLPFVEDVAMRVNYISVFTSAATIFVAFLMIWEVLTRVWSSSKLSVEKQDEELGTKKIVARWVGALGGAMLLTFSDTFWFNAVEAEVYGLAMLMVVIISYLALLWTPVADTPKGDRLLVMMAYLAFLGVGVHLYTLLTIPAVFLLLLIHKESIIKDRLLKISALFAVSAALIALYVFLGKIMEAQGGELFSFYWMIPLWFVVLRYIDPKSEKFDKWPIWISGVLLYSVVYNVGSFLGWTLMLTLTLAVLYFRSEGELRHQVRLSLWISVIALVGYSTHAYIPIRSALNPVIDENNPEIQVEVESPADLLGFFDSENWGAFQAFVERKQYGSESMISRAFYRRGQLLNQLLTFPHMGYGGYQLAQYLPWKVGEVRYYRPGIYNISPEENGPIERGALKHPTQMTKFGDDKVPQFLAFLIINLLILGSIYAVFVRKKSLGIYLLALYGISSAGLLFYINFADGTRLEKRDYDSWYTQMGSIQRQFAERGIILPDAPNPNTLNDLQREMARHAQDNNKLTALQSHPEWQRWRQIQSEFSRAGARPPEIPSPVHLEVRERDYFYAPAFIFMSIILGIGLAFVVVGNERKKNPIPYQMVAALLLVFVTAVPLYSNYKEHSRANLYVPWDYAWNLIQSCRPNSILFTNGDNDTFPLWFIQEVAGVRKDVRVVNLSLGNTDWYIHQLLDIEPIQKLSYSHAEIDSRLVYNADNARHPSHNVDFWVEQAQKVVPHLKANITELQKQLSVVASDSTMSDSLSTAPLLGVARKEAQAKLERFVNLYQIYDGLLEWGSKRKGGFMKTQDKLVVDLVQSNMNSPIHFAATVSSPNFVGLDKYMQMEGMVYTLVRGTLQEQKEALNEDRTRHLIDSVYQFRGLGDGSAWINGETQRLLYSYNTLYMKIALDKRTEIASLLRGGIKKGDSLGVQEDVNIQQKVKEAKEVALRYLEMGMKQFPGEWRNYLIASEICELALDLDKAKFYLKEGLKNVEQARDQEMLQARLTSFAAPPAPAKIPTPALVPKPVPGTPGK
jgi:hypothetical protein